MHAYILFPSGDRPWKDANRCFNVRIENKKIISYIMAEIGQYKMENFNKHIPNRINWAWLENGIVEVDENSISENGQFLIIIFAVKYRTNRKPLPSLLLIYR